MLLQLALNSLMLRHPGHLIPSECTPRHPRCCVSLSEPSILATIQCLPRLYGITIEHSSLLVIVKLSAEQGLLLLDTIRWENLCG
jgi:hypothetical protein